MRRVRGVPSQTLTEVAVEDGRANLQHAMGAFERPLHLLFFDHALSDKEIDSGLASERRSGGPIGNVRRKLRWPC